MYYGVLKTAIQGENNCDKCGKKNRWYCQIKRPSGTCISEVLNGSPATLIKREGNTFYLVKICNKCKKEFEFVYEK